MATTVQSRSNHYETLGLKPDAIGDEITRAFSRQMAVPRSAADVAQIGAAYEILRNPARRRAYDASIGIRPEPRAAPQPTLTFRSSARFSGSAPGTRIYGAQGERRVAEPPRAPVAVPEPQRAPEPRPAPFVAAPSAERSGAAPSIAPRREPPPAEAERSLPSNIDELIAAERDWTGEAAGRGASPARWSRTGLAVGGLFVAAALIGAWAGLNAGEAQEPAPAKAAVAKAARPRPATDMIAEAPAPVRQQAQPERAVAPPVAVAARETRRREMPAPVERQADQGLALPAGAAASPAIETAFVETPEPVAADIAPTPTAASAPLPNAVMARTIGRIGYACGQVASTTAVEGAPGVFKVTCTSGHSYRAAPVRGRYHFRRWSGE